MGDSEKVVYEYRVVRWQPGSLWYVIGPESEKWIWQYSEKTDAENQMLLLNSIFKAGVASVSLDSMLVKQTQENLRLQEKLKETEDKMIETQLNMLTQGSRYINTASALKKAVEIIKVWHGEPAWDIYF